MISGDSKSNKDQLFMHQIYAYLPVLQFALIPAVMCPTDATTKINNNLHDLCLSNFEYILLYIRLAVRLDGVYNY